MTKARLFILSAWVVHLTAWFVPVVGIGETFPQTLPGWDAFRFASSAMWPHEGPGSDPWYIVVLFSASALTTLLFVLGSVWVVWLGSQRVRRVSAWISACSFVLNAHWVVDLGSERLRIGYFLWWFSFALLALGLFFLSRRPEQQRVLKTGDAAQSAVPSI